MDYVVPEFDSLDINHDNLESRYMYICAATQDNVVNSNSQITIQSSPDPISVFEAQKRQRKRQKDAIRAQRYRKRKKEYLIPSTVVSAKENERIALKSKAYRHRQKELGIPTYSKTREDKQRNAQKNKQYRTREKLNVAKVIKNRKRCRRYRKRIAKPKKFLSDVSLKYTFLKFVKYLWKTICRQQPETTLIPLFFHTIGRLGRVNVNKRQKLWTNRKCIRVSLNQIN